MLFKRPIDVNIRVNNSLSEILNLACLLLEANDMATGIPYSTYSIQKYTVVPSNK